MNRIYIILLIVVFIVGLIAYQSQSIQRTYRDEVARRLRETGPAAAMITEKDIAPLPAPVQKYLRRSGAIGRAKPRNVRIVWEGAMRQPPKGAWMKFRFEQYNFFEQPARFFLIRGNMAGIPATGLDSYRNGKGNMLIKLGGIIPVVNAVDPKMDQAALVTYFNDMCLFTPGALLDRRIRWETIDATTVKATFSDSGLTISGILYFNDTGDLVNFITDDRYYSPTGKTYQKARWSTPIHRHRKLNGMWLPASCEAVWHFQDGDFCYAKFEIKEVAYNCANFQ